MERERIPGAGNGDRGGGQRKGRKRKAKRARPGLQVVERDGFWHVVGTVRVGALDAGRRSRRIRKSSGLPAIAECLADAETLRDTWAVEARHEAIHGRQPSRPTSIAVEAWLKTRRKGASGKPGWREAKIARTVVLRFGIRTIATVSAEEWTSLAESETAGIAPSSRERFLNGFMSLLNFCAHKSRKWIGDKTLPHFERDAAARKPKHRQRRHVAELRPDLIMLIIDNAGAHLKPQLWVEWSTGQRASAVLKPRLRDAILAEGREQITFPTTKTGEPVTASLHPAAGQALRDYLQIRGRLWDRDGPLFLTHRGKSYKTENDLSGHNRTAFNNARARAVAARRRQALGRALELRAVGAIAAAREIIGQALADIRLMRQVTQHWFRHLLATTMIALKAPMRVAMDQAGWLTVESLMAYAHDVPDVRRAVVEQLPIGPAARKVSA